MARCCDAKILKRASKIFTAAGAVFCLVCLPARYVFGSADGGLPGSFLLNPAGARGAAIGPSYAAFADEVSAIYWNPAQLASLPKPELGLSRTQLFEDTDHSFLGFSYPLGGHLALAGAYIKQASSGYEKRANPFDAPQSFSLSNEAFLAGGGVSLKAGSVPFKAGLVLKSVRHVVDNYSASGAGADAGLAFQPTERLSVAAVFRNLVRPGTKLINRETTYPSGLLLAAAYRAAVSGEITGVLSAGLLKYEHVNSELSAGLEFEYKKSAALRFGWEENGFSSGIGIRSGNYSLDYAALFHELSAVHTISLSVRFGITMRELEEYIKKGISRFDRQEAEGLARAYEQRADIYYREKNHLQAMKMYETAVLWDPENRELGLKLEHARSAMDRELNAQVTERNALIAMSYYEKGDLVSSREYWQNVLEINPSDARAKDYLSRIESRFTEKEKERLQDELTAVEQKKVLDLLSAANNLLKEEKYLLAAEKARRALAILPENPQGLLLVNLAKNGFALSVRKRLARGVELCDLKLYAEAMTVINSVLADEPGQKETLEIARKCRGTELSLTSEQTKKMEKLYYMAVDSYVKNNFVQAAARLSEIFAIDPLNDAARSLEEKIKKAQKVVQ